MTSTRTPFVDDLIPLILEASDGWWRQDYLRLAYVSSTWLFYIRKRLYACPSVSSFASSNALARTLYENPELVALVSGLELEPVATCHSGMTTTAVDIASIQYLLGLEGLKRVKLGGELARQAERFLASMAYPEQVEELIIDGRGLHNADEVAAATMEWDSSMSYRFMALKKLKFANLELEVVPPDTSCHFPINHLILDNIDILGGFLCQMVTAVTTLEVSAKSACEFDEQVRLLLDHCDVQKLKYEVENNHRAHQSFLESETGTTLALRRLQLVGHTVDASLLNEVTERCSSLEELVVEGRSVSITVQEWQSFLASGAVPALGRLGLPGGSHLPPYVKWSPVDLEALQSASLPRRVQLV